jgi:hypothetical protein
VKGHGWICCSRARSQTSVNHEIHRPRTDSPVPRRMCVRRVGVVSSTPFSLLTLKRQGCQNASDALNELRHYAVRHDTAELCSDNLCSDVTATYNQQARSGLRTSLQGLRMHDETDCDFNRT